MTNSPPKAAAVSSHWSHFSGGLLLFLQNFLRIQDCFKAISEGQCLVVDFEFQYIDSFLNASGEVSWQLPEVRFLNLPNSRLSGEEYRITPFLLKDLQSPVSSPVCDDYVDKVTYTIPRSAMSFGWDAMKQCFRTILPESEDVSLIVPTRWSKHCQISSQPISIVTCLLTYSSGRGVYNRDCIECNSCYSFPRRRTVSTAVTVEHQTRRCAGRQRLYAFNATCPRECQAE